jgi:hypothetical protein
MRTACWALRLQTHYLKSYNAFCFSNATMVAGTHLIDTLIRILPSFEIQNSCLAKADALLKLSTSDFPLSSMVTARAHSNAPVLGER